MILNFFLGIRITRSEFVILLNQRKYALELISGTGLSGAKPVNTPLETTLKLIKEEYDEMTRVVNDPIHQDVTVYQFLGGRLLYLNITRHDIIFKVQLLSQFVN